MRIVRRLAAPLVLVAARARRRPGRWLAPALGIALATAFAGAVAVQSTIAGDQSARSVLGSISPLQRAVRVTWQGVVTAAVAHQARALLTGLGLKSQTQVVLLNPVRLSGIVVRPAAIDPLSRWIFGSAAARSRQLAMRCNTSSCPVLLAGGAVRHRLLSAAGVHVVVVSSARLRSAAPLAFTPGPGTDEPPLLLSGDVAGLNAVSGLSGLYRTHGWLALLPTATLNSWQLASTEQSLQRAQATLLTSGSQFSLTAPFDALDAARAQASAAPKRLLLAGGGALAALAMFIVLAAGGLRRDQRADIERLRAAGARAGQCLVLALGEAAWLCAVSLLVGAGLSVAIGALLAGGADLPVAGVLGHSLLTPVGALVLVGGWVGCTALVGVVLLAPDAHAADLLAVAAVAALALALGRGESGSDPLPVLLAPLCCLAAGVLTFRASTALLRGAERLARRGPVLTRLAFVSLARAPAGPSLAIAFIAASTGLGGFALVYRATLLRGTADQAADRVPLDATISPAADFTTPLQLASLQRWRTITGGEVLPVRRSAATFPSGANTVTVPALGVPSAGLVQIHGWRAGDGSASLRTLAQRLTVPGPVRVPGPVLPASARSLSLRLSAPAAAVAVSADLRNSAGAIRQLTLGDADVHPRTVRAMLPPGSWELEALELDEPAGLEITNGHQNGENAAAATQFTITARLGPLLAMDRSGHRVLSVDLRRWRGVGAAKIAGSDHAGTMVRFAAIGAPGLLRPLQPSDLHPIPVLVDPQTADNATPGGNLALTIDGLPVSARIVGILRRFPTLASDAPGFVVADEAVLASALDAQLPGQGRADELWISTSDPQRLRAALGAGKFAGLAAAFRADIQRGLRSAPLARGVLRTLVAAAALSLSLAVLGLLVALLGGARDRRVELDLVAQGIGPRALARELRLRFLIAGVLGVLVGLVIALVLTRLAVASVQAADTVATAGPSLVTVTPAGQLAAWCLGALAALTAASLLATRSLAPRRRVT